MENQLAVDEEMYLRKKQLYENEVIPEYEYLTYQSAYLQKKYSFENMDINLLNNNLRIREIEDQISELQQQLTEAKQRHKLLLEQTYKQLVAGIAQWEYIYTFIAPISGKVTFLEYWSENQFVSAGEELLVVLGNDDELVAKAMVPALGFGKVKKNQDVNIKLEGFPFEEYGTLNGTIKDISLIAVNGQYVVTIDLPNGLVTNYGITIDYMQDMSGIADIVTLDMRLLERFFYRLIKLVSKKPNL